MDNPKKLSDIASKVTPVEEDQQGQLSGVFASFSSSVAGLYAGWKLAFFALARLPRTNIASLHQIS
jgi:hypothetical protein